MKVSDLFLAGFVVLSFSSAGAEQIGPGVGKGMPDREWYKHSGELGVILALTSNPDAFLKEWRETAASHSPVLDNESRVKRGEEISALVFYYGCAKEGEICAATVDVTILSPDGKVYAKDEGAPVSSRQAPSPRLLLLSDAWVEVAIPRGAPTGAYTVVAEFRRPGANLPPVVVRRQFTVVE